MNGGGLSGKLISQFFDYIYNYKKYELSVPDDYIFLDSTNYYLNNDNFMVFINISDCMIVAVHCGTRINKIRDVGNNIRNILCVQNDICITNRNLHAKNGHMEIINFLKKIYENINDYSSYQCIYNKINSLKTNEMTIEDAIIMFLKENLITIGHSQGAIYAYLYGDQGKETIVVNPAPFIGVKPKNVVIIKVEGDPISLMTTGPILKKENTNRLNILKAHLTSNLKDDEQIYGVDGVYKINGYEYYDKKNNFLKQFTRNPLIKVAGGKRKKTRKIKKINRKKIIKIE